MAAARRGDAHRPCQRSSRPHSSADAVPLWAEARILNHAIRCSCSVILLPRQICSARWERRVFRCGELHPQPPDELAARLPRAAPASGPKMMRSSPLAPLRRRARSGPPRVQAASPAIAGTATNGGGRSSSKLPVMVAFHGGGFCTNSYATRCDSLGERGELRDGARVVWCGGGRQTAAEREADSLGERRRSLSGEAKAAANSGREPKCSERGRRKRSGGAGEAAQVDACATAERRGGGKSEGRGVGTVNDMDPPVGVVYNN
ncbi:hypothetical protein SETIT_5G341400v2 [Setaria italica]|uniref:Alpha/beta hydrolase fold-3 domain-containing protein n=1 Tax=Setaria italica TaxID=4555 RepID=K3XL25_SETIT|nr:hypothetical protein SETIT_5G341400v2 [Setaria italica]